MDLHGASWFSELAEARPVWVYGIPACWLKKLCLSILMSENLKLKKVNKSFVPEQKECRQVFRVFSDSYTRVDIVNVFSYLHEYIYFTYSYLGRIFGWNKSY